MGRVLLLFIDGVGIGRPDPARNPLVDTDILATFLPDDWQPMPDGGRPATLPEPVRRHPLPAGGRLRATDPSLGIGGLPQSATGQTTLFTGVNAAAELGHHLYGFPGPTLRRILQEHSILKRAGERGLSAAFFNAFRPIFFELGDAIWEKPMSASSWMNRAAGLHFRSFDDLRAGRALYHDYSNREAIHRGFDLPEWSPEEAGQRLAGLAGSVDLGVFEFFMTDRVGHTGDLTQARPIVQDLDRFVAAVVHAIDPHEQTVVVTSDHGNVEEMSVRSHTHHPVPTMAWGPGADRLIERLGRLEDFAPALLAAATGELS